MKRQEPSAARPPGQFLVWATAFGVLFVLGAALPGGAHAADSGRKAFRVCAPPNNLPFSDRKEEGFENKVAHVFAKDLGLPVKYTWYPQQMGFGRNTLGKYLPKKGRYRCDVIMSTTKGLEAGQTTKPWYRSTYVIVYRKDIADHPLKTPEDFLNLPKAKRSQLKIGVFTRSPGATWLVDHNLMDQASSYKMNSGSWQSYPGQVIARDMARGDIDAAIVWGPIGGYFTKRLQNCDDCAHKDFGLIPMNGEKGYSFVYSISMGVRYSDDKWKATLNHLIEKDRQQIDRILAAYHVPRVTKDGRVVWGQDQSSEGR